MSLQGEFLKILFDITDDLHRERNLPFSNSSIYYSNIKSATKLTQGEDVKDIYEIILDTKDISYNFLPGDTIGILPRNNLEELQKIFKCLNCEDIINHRCTILLTDEKKKRLISHLPTNTTLKDVFLKYVDIRSPPKKSFLKILAKYTKNTEEHTILENLSSAKNSDYIPFILNNGRSLSKLLETFPSCTVPIVRILENLPPLQPRPYSISSSPLLENEIHITFSIEYFDKDTKGVCTGWMESIIKSFLEDEKASGTNGKNIQFYFRKPSAFRLTSHINTPIIMIAPGTGVAPFVGFLQHLFLEQKVIPTWLFYGCRYRDKDYLYRNKLEAYIVDKCLAKLSIVFSREHEKLHIQDIIIRESVELYEKLVTECAIIYVCGGKNMMESVKESIKTCLVNNGMTVENSNLFVSNMIKSQKYIEDQWI